MGTAHTAPQWLSIVLPLVIIAVVFAVRIRRMGRERPLRVERLWIVPALYLAVATAAFLRFPPGGIAWLWCAIALAAGSVLGWQRGRMMRISVDPVSHALSQRASPAAMLFLLGLVAIRFVARGAFEGGGAAAPEQIMMLTDVLIAFALGLLSVQRLEMYLRARRLLDAARAR